MIHTVIFYQEGGRILGVTHCSDDHAELQSHPAAEHRLIVEDHLMIEPHSAWRVEGGALVPATGSDNDH